MISSLTFALFALLLPYPGGPQEELCDPSQPHSRLDPERHVLSYVLDKMPGAIIRTSAPHVS